MTKSGLIGAAFAAAAIIVVFVAAQGMRNSDFIVMSYVATAAIIGLYVWSLGRRLSQAEQQKQAREGGA